MASLTPLKRRPAAQVICMLTWAMSHRRRNCFANAFVRAFERRKDGASPKPVTGVWKATVLDIARSRSTGPGSTSGGR